MTSLGNRFGRPIGRRALLLGAAASAGAATGFGALGFSAFAASDREFKLWTPGGSTQFCSIQEDIVKKFIATGADLGSVAVQCGVGDNTEFSQVLLGSIAAGNPPDVSIVWDSPVSLGAKGAYVPLDDYMAKSKNLGAENWGKGLLATCQFKGQTFGLPVTAGVYSMWYNQELFEARGLPSDRASFPKTWDDMRRISKEFTRWDGDRLEVAGFMPPRQPETLPIWSRLNGSQMFDAEALRYTIDSPENIEMFNYFMAWWEEEYRGDIKAIDRSGSFDSIYPSPDGLPPAFQQNRQAGLQSGSWAIGDIYGDNPPEFERWNLAPYPVGPAGSLSVSGTWPNWFVIPKGAPNVQDSIDYLDYLAVEGVLDWYQAIPDVPTNRKVVLKPPAGLAERRGAEIATELSTFLARLTDVAVPMWNSPVESFGNDQISRAMEAIYTKAATVEDALKGAQTESQNELDRALAAT